MCASPLSQFELKAFLHMPSLFGHSIDFTNSTLFMMLITIFVVVFLWSGSCSSVSVPSRYQMLVESFYDFVASMIRSNIGEKGMVHFPIVFTMFIFVLCCNLTGMIPFCFTVTSHISVTAFLAVVAFIYVNVVAFKTFGLKFFKIFLPAGTPWWMAPLLVLIEVFAYMARPFSLSVRLAANMMAGHTMLKIIAGFVLNMNIVLALLPLSFIVALTGLEIFVSILQAYIFTVLTCVYLNDALNMH